MAETFPNEVPYAYALKAGTADRTLLDGRAAAADVTAHTGAAAAHGATGAVVGTTNAQTLTNKTLTAPAIASPTGLVKADVGLGNVDNTSDASKPVSTATTTALAAKASLTQAVALWSASIAYAAADLARGSDGAMYRAAASTTNHNPTTNDGTQWLPVLIVADTTLSVPSRFATINAAWAYLASARVANSATVTIQVADGTYDYGNNTLTANHDDGARIQLLGDAATPANCTIAWDGSRSGIIVTHSNRLGLVRGFNLIGQGDGSVPPFTLESMSVTDPTVNGDAVGAYYGASVRVQDCTFSKWLHGVTAWGASSAHVTDCVGTACWDSAFFAYSSSSLYANGCEGNENDSGGGSGLGYGFISELGSNVFAEDCTADDNAVAGFCGITGGTLELRGSEASGNAVAGVQLRMSFLECFTCNFSSNAVGADGIQMLNGSRALVSGTTISNNGEYGIYAENGSFADASDGTLFLSNGVASSNAANVWAGNGSYVHASGSVAAIGETVEDVLDGDFQLEGAADAWTAVLHTTTTPHRVTLGAGTWDVIATVRGLARPSAAGLVSVEAKLRDTTNAADVPNSTVWVTSETTSGEYRIDTATIRVRVTLTSSTAIGLWARWGIAASVTQASIQSDARGVTKIRAARVLT